jgi:hypothetical protein
MARKLVTAAFLVSLLAGIAVSQNGSSAARRITAAELPEAQFHLVRLIYGNRGRGFFNGYWAIDYPDAEKHFLPALKRLTGISVADDSIHLDAMDDRIFDYPFMFAQQVGQGYWVPDAQEAERMREYLARGGFLLVDDIHGERDWAIFEAAMARILPGQSIVEIPDEDPLMHVFYDLSDRLQIPGRRHLMMSRGGEVLARMAGPPHWRGIYDDRGRLIVAVNYNIDMGDAWEHADDYYYPVPMTHLAYRLGVNYVIYALTH